jgi:hypothetical protein
MVSSFKSCSVFPQHADYFNMNLIECVGPEYLLSKTHFHLTSSFPGCTDSARLYSDKFMTQNTTAPPSPPAELQALSYMSPCFPTQTGWS